MAWVNSGRQAITTAGAPSTTDARRVIWTLASLAQTTRQAVTSAGKPVIVAHRTSMRTLKRGFWPSALPNFLNMMAGYGSTSNWIYAAHRPCACTQTCTKTSRAGHWCSIGSAFGLIPHPCQLQCDFNIIFFF